MYPAIIKNKSLENILVFGGTGYLGGSLVNRMINKYNLNEQYNIIILSSRKNTKKYESLFKNVYLFNNIDCFEPDSYKELLPNGMKNHKCKYIIHSIGIFNTNLAYKNLINNKSLCKIPTLLSNYVYSAAKNSFERQDQQIQLDTVKKFYKWNYQSLENIVENVSNPKTKLIYISANKSPLASKEYIDSKRLSEKLLLEKSEQNCIDGIIVRPGIIYDNRLKNLSLWELLRLILKNEQKISLRDLMNYLISNNFVFNKNLYFTNIDKLSDKICAEMLKDDGFKRANRIINNKDISS